MIWKKYSSKHNNLIKYIELKKNNTCWGTGEHRALRLERALPGVDDDDEQFYLWL